MSLISMSAKSAICCFVTTETDAAIFHLRVEAGARKGVGGVVSLGVLAHLERGKLHGVAGPRRFARGNCNGPAVGGYRRELGLIEPPVAVGVVASELRRSGGRRLLGEDHRERSEEHGGRQRT